MLLMVSQMAPHSARYTRETTGWVGAICLRAVYLYGVTILEHAHLQRPYAATRGVVTPLLMFPLNGWITEVTQLILRVSPTPEVIRKPLT
jgi:hypothetical protein